jgi:hypothetical protein
VFVAYMRQRASGKATDAISTKASNAAAAEATHVAAAKAAAHVASAKAAHAPATVSSATTAAAGLCTRGKAAGNQRGCQNHHHSSSHDILRWDGRTCRRRSFAKRWRPKKANANVAMDWRWKRPFVVSTKFVFICNEFRVSERDMS